MLDNVINPNDPTNAERNLYTVDEKAHFLLGKLYDLYDNYAYPIKDILVGNGIALKRYDEEREFSNLLTQYELAESVPGSYQVCLRLTLKGAQYVENNRKPYIENYSNISDTQTEFSNKIQEIIERLEKLDCGNELLFNELQDIKNPYDNLNKKQIGQLLKGKLIDLALSKAVDLATIKLIYSSLTGGNDLQLPNGS